MIQVMEVHLHELLNMLMICYSFEKAHESDHTAQKGTGSCTTGSKHQLLADRAKDSKTVRPT